MSLLHAMTTNGDSHKVGIKMRGKELVNTVHQLTTNTDTHKVGIMLGKRVGKTAHQLTNVTNVTIAHDDNNR